VPIGEGRALGQELGRLAGVFHDISFDLPPRGSEILGLAGLGGLGAAAMVAETLIRRHQGDHPGENRDQRQEDRDRFSPYTAMKRRHGLLDRRSQG